MNDLSDYISYEQSIELSHSSSESSSQTSSNSGVSTVVNWVYFPFQFCQSYLSHFCLFFQVNELFDEDDAFSKVSSLKDLANGEVFVQIIQNKFQYHFDDENSFYVARSNYAIIRHFLVKELLIKVKINYDLAIEGDELELGKVSPISHFMVEF